MPVRKPLPSGLNGTKPMPNLLHVGSTCGSGSQATCQSLRSASLAR